MYVADPFWKQFKAEQSKTEEANIDRLKAALASLDVAHVNVHYTYRFSNDSGSGYASPVTMIKTDGSEINIGERWRREVTVDVQPFNDAKVSIEEVWSKNESEVGGNPLWSIQRRANEVDVLAVIELLPIVDTSFMLRHGSTHTEGEYDDEGGTSYKDLTEGKARIDALTLKVSPLDELGNVVNIEKSFGHGHW